MADEARSILTAGYVTLDIVTYRGSIWRATGGTAGNVAAILGFMGWNSAVVADLGDDQAGREICRDFQKMNVSVELVRLSTRAITPRLVHEIDGAGHRYRFRCPICDEAFPRSRPLRKDRALELTNLDLSPDIFFFDRLNAGTLLLAEYFASVGSLIIFEPSRPSRAELTERMLDVADIIKFADNRPSGLDSSLPQNHQSWIITRAQQGADYRIGNGAWRRSPAFTYPVVDAGGAGDWTTAGLIHSLPRHGRLTLKTLGDSLRWAQALAAVSCGAPGARGLARQQSAEAVMRAAKFLEQRGERADTGDQVDDSYMPSMSLTTCAVCLQPKAAGGAKTSTVA